MRTNNELYKNQGIHVINTIFTVDNGVVKVLLVKRSNEPYKDMWALVGGALYNNESIEDGVRREIEEKSGIKNVSLYQFGAFDELGKTPTINMRMIAISYLGIVDSNKVDIIKHTRTTKNIDWVPINDVKELAFSHNEILQEGIKKLQELIVQSDILKSLLSNEFTMPELQKVFESILNKKYDRRNFRKKVLSLDIIEDVNKEVSINGNKPSKLYRFKKKINNKRIF